MKTQSNSFSKKALLGLFFTFIIGQNVQAQFTEGEYYTIISALSNDLVLDIEHASAEAGANLIVGGNYATDNQLFQFQYAGGGYWYILSKLRDNFAIDVDGAKTEAGTNVHLWDLNETAAQKFKLVDAGGGYYYIQSAIQPDYVLDISGGSREPGTNIWMYSLNRTAAQKFKLEQQSNNSIQATFNDANVNRPRQPITLYLQNKGDFIAKFQVEYTAGNKLPSVESFTDKRRGWSHELLLPYDAHSITVWASVYTDFAWDKTKTVIDGEWQELRPGGTKTISLSGNYHNPKVD